MNKPVVANRLLFDREKMREHELHQARLKTMKSVLNNKAPKQYNHLTNGTSCKTKTIMPKYLEMQNENRVLLKKMLSIDLKPSNLNPTKITLKAVPSQASLNRLSRLKELIRVNQENKNMLRRLQQASSTYDKRRWDKEFETNEYFIDMIRRNSSRYIKHPYFLYTPSSNFQFSSQGEFYTSVHSGRTMSAQPMSRQSAVGFRQGLQDPKTLQPIMEGAGPSSPDQMPHRMMLVQSEQNLRPFTAPNVGVPKTRKKNRKIMSGFDKVKSGANQQEEGGIDNLGEGPHGEEDAEAEDEMTNEGMIPVSQEVLQLQQQLQRPDTRAGPIN